MSYGQNSFNKDCNFTSINFGVNKPLLETELNEMQLILGTKPKEVIHTIFGDGLLTDTKAPFLNYASGTFTMTNTQAMINGELLVIDSLRLTGLSNGNTIYLVAWYEDVTPSSLIPKYGNKQSTTTVANHILDERIGETTSTRKQLVYDLSKTEVQGKMNLLIGRIASNQLQIECVNIRENLGGGLDLEALYPILEPYETKVIADGKHSQTLKDAKAYTDSRITALQSTVTGLSNTVNTLQSKVTVLENKATGLESKVTSLESKSKSLETKVTNLESKATSLENKATGLENKVTILESKSTSLESKVTGLENTVKGLKASLLQLVNLHIENLGGR